MTTSNGDDTLARPDRSEAVASFGRFELDLETGELRRDGRLRHLAPQPALLLSCLVKRAGQLVTRDELRELLWEGRVVEADQGLNACMLQIRRALGDRARNPLFVRTVPRKGYCFIAPVTVGQSVREDARRGERSGDRPGGGARPVSDSSWLAVQPLGRFGARALALVLPLLAAATLLVVMASIGTRGREPEEGDVRSEESPKRSPRIVVLPFRSLGGEEHDRYFAEGLTEEITTFLARERALSIIAPDSARMSAQNGASLADLADLLEVDYVLEGTARRDGARYRVSARLSDARSETLVWSRSYDREDLGPLDVQVEVAGRVVDSLVANEIGMTRSDSGSDPDLVRDQSVAQESFLIGRHLLRHGRREQLGLAIDYLETAVDRAPRMAGAQLALATGRLRAGRIDEATYRKAVLDALGLDPELAGAHLALGRLKLYSDWDFEGAEDSYRAALRLEPSHSQAHHALAMLLAIVGRSVEAIDHIERARALDPVSFTMFADAGLVYFMASRFEESVEVCSRALEIDPTRLGLLRCRLDAHIQLGDLESALDDAHSLMTRSGASPRTLASVEEGTPDERLESFYRWQLESLQAASASPTALAAALLPLGEIDRCFELLELAFETRSSGVLMVAADPRAAPFKNDPRLLSLVERIGLTI